MGEKMEAAKKYRAENGQKWAEYTGPFTPEIIQQMREDNEKLTAFAKEATKEWLAEKKQKKYYTGTFDDFVQPREKVKNILPEVDCSGIIPPKEGDLIYDIRGIDKYCKEHNIDPSSLTDKELQCFVTGEY